MPDFKFAKGFFTGVLVTDIVIATGLLFFTWRALKSREDYNRPLNRHDSYSEYRKYKQGLVR